METIHGRPFAAEAETMPAAQVLANGGSVQDALTRPIREAEAREAEAIAKAAQVQQAAQPVRHVVASDSEEVEKLNGDHDE